MNSPLTIGGYSLSRGRSYAAKGRYVMSGVPRAFSRQGAVELEVLESALQPKFSLASEPEIAATHTWLDTFDWRLHSAGISLGFVDDGPLTMQLPDGTRLQAPRAGVKWPASRTRCRTDGCVMR